MARDFDGSTGYLALGDPTNLAGTRPMTIGAWIRTDTTTGAHRIFSYYASGVNRGWSYGQFGANQRFTIHGVADVDSSSAGVQLATSTWYFIAAALSSTNVKFVRIAADGTINTQDVANSSAHTGTPTDGRIAAIAGTSAFVDGRLCHLGIWLGDELSADELRAFAFAGPYALGRVPDGYWPIWGQASPEPDLSGSAKNGTLNGTAGLADHAPVGRYVPDASAGFASRPAGAIDVPFIAATTTMYGITLTGLGTLEVPFIAAATSLFAPMLVGTIPVPFIAAGTTLYAPTLQAILSVPFISSATTVYAPTLTPVVSLGSISSSTVLYAPTLRASSIPLGFITAQTLVMPPTLRKGIVNVIAPSVMGTAQQGSILTAGPGVWDGTPPMQFAYQWQRDTGGGYANISSATNAQYALVAADVGATVRVRVTASYA